jgi:DNA-binding NarL/FixJ family response regulator
MPTNGRDETRLTADAVRRMHLLVVDSSPLLLAGLSTLLGRRPEFEVTAAAESWDVRLSGAASIEAAMVDVANRKRDGWVDVERLRDALPATLVVVMDDGVRESRLRRAMRQGLAGYVLKYDPIENLSRTILEIRRKDFVVSTSVDLSGVGNGRLASVLRLLTEREIEIVRHVGDGLPMKSIAERLRISENTLDNHKTRILGKLGMHRLADLVRFAIGSGLSQIDETNCFPPGPAAESA